MSRTNPLKKKKRAAKQSILIYGEGLGEKMFLKHLHKLYHSRDRGMSIVIEGGEGGAPQKIVDGAVNRLGRYSRCIVIVDNDRGEREMEIARTEAKKEGVEMIEHTPCLEALLLEIVHGKNFSHKSSAWCKKEFQSRYIEKGKRRGIREYEKVFPKELLDRKREEIPELNALISVMES